MLRTMFLNVSVLNTLNMFTDLNGPNENIICTMDEVWKDFFRAATPVPAAVRANKIKLLDPLKAVQIFKWR